jgi:hypothetical protein
MGPITMIRAAVILMATGALGGVVVAIVRLTKQLNPPD